MIKKNIKNSFSSISEAIVIPLVNIIATPILVSKLTLAQYGIIMLSNSISGVIGVINIGTNEATVKYVSHYRGKKDDDGINNSINTTLALSFLLFLIISIVGFLLAPVLVNKFFNTDQNYINTNIIAVQIGIFGLGLKTVSGVFTASIRGFERYDLIAIINISSAIIMITSSVILAVIGLGVISILISNLVVIALTLITSALILKNIFSTYQLRPKIHQSNRKEVLSFGFFTWLQSLAGLIFSQADRLIIASTLGVSSLAIYSLAIQIGQQVHSLAASALAFLFPMISAKNQDFSKEELKIIYFKALKYNLIISLAVVLPILFFSKTLLTLWLGSAFAEQSYMIVNLLTISYFFLSLNVVPHYFLLGIGEVKFVSLTNVLSGVASLVGVLIFIPILGMNGAAIGRFFYSPIIFLNFIKVKNKLKRN